MKRIFDNKTEYDLFSKNAYNFMHNYWNFNLYSKRMNTVLNKMVNENFFRYIVLVIGSFFFKNRQSKVLFYHDIHKKDRYTTMSTSLELFKEHIYTIRNKSFEIVSEITKKDNQIKLQFDDGYKGIYDCLNFLINKKIPVEIFIVTSQIGKDNFLNKKQILELFDSGLVTISSHTHSHCNLSSIRREDLSK